MNYLANPEIFQINRIEAHSDHKYYTSIDEMKEKEMKFKQSLNGYWSFSFAKNLNSRVTNFFENDYDYSGWDTIKVPGHIQLQGYEAPHYVNTMYPWDGHSYILPPEIPQDYNPVGSYIRTFDVPADWNKEKVFISFQGVESAFNVWVNGEFVGYSEDTFTPGEFDITKFLKEGENKLAVEVIKWCSGSWMEDQDFWRLSGIFRDVYLYSYPEVHVKDVFVKTDLDYDAKSSSLDVEIKLDNDKEQEIEIFYELFSKDGEKVASSEVIKTTETELTLNNAELIENLELWSAEKPNLYYMHIYLKGANGEVIEVVPQKVGFRKFEMIDKIMHINGKRIVFKGVNRHEFNCYNGRVMSEEDMLWDVNFIKKSNFNAVRASHYPNNTRWYELCDEYGLYVIDEANIETHGSWQKMGAVEPDWAIPGDNEEWLGMILDRAASMLERDKNHPSIIIWSVGNEAWGGSVLYKMSEYFRETDPSRLVHYEGVFRDRSYNDTSDMETRMYPLVWEIEEYLNDNPTKPFISCEYTHAMGNSNGAMHKYTELENKYPMYQGGFIWDYIDQGIMTTDRFGNEYLAYGGDFGDEPTDYNFCVNGLVYADRRPSPKMQEVKQLFCDFKLHPAKDELLIKNESLFTNINEYDLVVMLKRDGETIHSYKTSADVEPLSEKTIKLDLAEQTIGGEYTVEVNLVLRTETKWANKNHEVCFGQFVYEVEQELVELEPKKVFIENSDVNLGVKGENFHIIFSKFYGSMVSAKYNDKQFLQLPPFPHFWRAPVDNDFGCKMQQQVSQWKIASLYPKVENIDIQDNKDSATITYTYSLSTTPMTYCDVAYTVDSFGKINVKMSYKAADGISIMPAFGMMMKVSPDLENVKWYGNGPEETYIDRKHGAKLGIFENKVADNVAEYVIPQETGNKTNVRWFEVTDNMGRGLRISAKNNFEFSALPYTSHELESARHHFELSPVHNTVLTINKFQMGIGGDDSWMSMPHDEYLFDGDKNLEFEFDIEFC